jgi:uncharacterized membrane protein
MKNCKSLFGDYEGYAARIEDARQLTFLIERLESGHVAVFVPSAPSPQSGSVYFMAEDQIKPVNIPPASALKCLRRLGGWIKCVAARSVGLSRDQRFEENNKHLTSYSQKQ